MSQADNDAARVRNGRVGIPAGKMEGEKKTDQDAQGYVRCSACGRAYPPEPMIEGRCWLCRHGITLNNS